MLVVIVTSSRRLEGRINNIVVLLLCLWNTLPQWKVVEWAWLVLLLAWNLESVLSCLKWVCSSICVVDVRCPTTVVLAHIWRSVCSIGGWVLVVVIISQVTQDYCHSILSCHSTWVDGSIVMAIHEVIVLAVKTTLIDCLLSTLIVITWLIDHNHGLIILRMIVLMIHHHSIVGCGT